MKTFKTLKILLLLLVCQPIVAQKLTKIEKRIVNYVKPTTMTPLHF